MTIQSSPVNCNKRNNTRWASYRSYHHYQYFSKIINKQTNNTPWNGFPCEINEKKTRKLESTTWQWLFVMRIHLRWISWKSCWFVKWRKILCTLFSTRIIYSDCEKDVIWIRVWDVYICVYLYSFHRHSLFSFHYCWFNHRISFSCSLSHILISFWEQTKTNLHIVRWESLSMLYSSSRILEQKS